MYSEFLGKLKQEINKGLPGWEAQKRMAPHGRTLIHYDPEVKSQSRQSGVLIWLYPNENKIFTRLILRAEFGIHSGQVALPGGQVEPSDGSFWNTALREACEEVGLERDKISLIGALTPLYIPPSDFWVHPFIGAGENILPGVINKSEVTSYFDIDIFQLRKPLIKEEKLITLPNGGTINAPCYILDGHIVWGATAMILSELEELVRRSL